MIYVCHNLARIPNKWVRMDLIGNQLILHSLYFKAKDLGYFLYQSAKRKGIGWAYRTTALILKSSLYKVFSPVPLPLRYICEVKSLLHFFIERVSRGLEQKPLSALLIHC